MNALNRLSIRTRLYFGTVFSLVLLVVIGAMGYLALERTVTRWKCCSPKGCRP
jgi:methyl-accepting chemotaxis protein